MLTTPTLDTAPESEALPVPQLLTPAQVADALAVSIQTIRVWERSGRLAAVRLAHGVVRFDVAAVRAFVASADVPRKTAPPELLAAGGRPRGRRRR